MPNIRVSGASTTGCDKGQGLSPKQAGQCDQFAMPHWQAGWAAMVTQVKPKGRGDGIWQNSSAAVCFSRMEW